MRECPEKQVFYFQKQMWKAAPKKSGDSAKKHRDSKHSTADKKEDRVFFPIYYSNSINMALAML